MSSIATEKQPVHAKNGANGGPSLQKVRTVSKFLGTVQPKDSLIRIDVKDVMGGGDDDLSDDVVEELIANGLEEPNENAMEVEGGTNAEVDDDSKDTNGKKLKRARDDVDDVDDDVHSDGGSTITTASTNGTPKKKQKVEGGGGGTRSKKQKKVTDPRSSYFAKLFGFYHLIAAAVFAVIKPLTEVEEKTRTEPDTMLTLAVKYLAKTLSKEETGTIEAWALGDDIARFSELDVKALELSLIHI